MTKKVVLAKEAFYVGGIPRQIAWDLIEALSQGQVSYKVCTACNRIHFVSGEASSLSKRRIRELQRRATEDPERYVEQSEPFDWLELPTFWRKPYPAHVITVPHCPCMFILEHQWRCWNRGTSFNIAEKPECLVYWKPDGKSFEVVVQVTLPDQHVVTRTYSVDLVTVEYCWGEHRYPIFYLTNIQPPQGAVEAVVVGLSPHNAVSVFFAKWMNAAAWNYASKVFTAHSTARLLAGEYGRRIPNWFEMVKPRHRLDDLGKGKERQEEILALIQAAKENRPVRVARALSAEELGVFETNRTFAEEVKCKIVEIEEGEDPRTEVLW